MEITSYGNKNFRRFYKDIEDDFKIDVRIMRKVPEEELKNRCYPYSWEILDGRIEFQDIGVADKDFCIGIYEVQ